MPLYVAAYDISDARRRRVVAAVLRRYGERVQRSVFEVRVEFDDLRELKRSIGPHLGAADDFDLFPIDERDPRRRQRWRKPPRVWSPVILC